MANILRIVVTSIIGMHTTSSSVVRTSITSGWSSSGCRRRPPFRPATSRLQSSQLRALPTSTLRIRSDNVGDLEEGTVPVRRDGSGKGEDDAFVIFEGEFAPSHGVSLICLLRVSAECSSAPACCVG